MLDNVLDDLTFLDRLLPGEINMDVLAGPRGAGDIEAREVAALTTAPTTIGIRKGHGHARTLGQGDGVPVGVAARPQATNTPS